MAFTTRRLDNAEIAEALEAAGISPEAQIHGLRTDHETGVVTIVTSEGEVAVKPEPRGPQDDNRRGVLGG